jgi:futalosine hydrolase
MKVLLVSATKLEIAPILSNFIYREKLGDNFHRYTFEHDHVIDVLITGVSMVAMAFKMGKYLNKSYDVVINIGICGAFNKKLKIGEVVHVATDKFSELGVEDGERFLSLIDIDLLQESDYPITE